MTLEQQQTLLKYLQCKQSKFANKVASALSIGVCSEEMLNKLVLSSYILEVFYRYNTAYTEEDDNCLTICQLSDLKNKFMLTIR